MCEIDTVWYIQPVIAKQCCPSDTLCFFWQTASFDQSRQQAWLPPPPQGAWIYPQFPDDHFSRHSPASQLEVNLCRPIYLALSLCNPFFNLHIRSLLPYGALSSHDGALLYPKAPLVEKFGVVCASFAFCVSVETMKLEEIVVYRFPQLGISTLLAWDRGVVMITESTLLNSRPVWGRGTPLRPLSIYFLIFYPLYFSLSFIGFIYFLLFSIPSLSTRIVPLRFQAGGRRRRPNLGLVFVF